MNKDLIRAKCDSVLLEKRPVFSQILNQRIQKVYEKYADTLGIHIDYMLFTAFMSEILTSYSGVVSEIMVQIIQEIFSDDEEVSSDDDLDEFD